MKKPKKRKLRKGARPQGGNYVKKVENVTLVRVLHDDDCGIFSGESCDCVMTLVVRPDVEPTLN